MQTAAFWLPAVDVSLKEATGGLGLDKVEKSNPQKAPSCCCLGSSSHPQWRRCNYLAALSSLLLNLAAFNWYLCTAFHCASCVFGHPVSFLCSGSFAFPVCLFPFCLFSCKRSHLSKPGSAIALFWIIVICSALPCTWAIPKNKMDDSQ